MPLLAHSVAGLASSAGVRACLAWLRRERNWVNDQHLKVCRIPAPTFLEQKRAEWMADRFRAIGWEAKLDRAGNVVASLPGRKDGPAVAVTAHLDTVLAPRSADDIRLGDDGRFLGPGVSDNGAGLAALLALAAAWIAAPPFEDPALSPVLVANVGEEGEGNLSGMRYLCRSGNGLRLKSFLVLDGPSTDHITSQALASRRFEVAITGPGGHSWRDHGVANPVHALSQAIAWFTEQAGEIEGAGPTAARPDVARPIGELQRSSSLGSDSQRSSFNVGIMEGGSSINSIPTEARAKVDLRSENIRRIEQMAAALASAVERAVDRENKRSVGGRVAVKLKEIGSRPSGALAGDAPILEYVRAVDAHLGIRSHLDCSSTDANIPLSLGLPALSIGAGGQGGGAHTPGEWFLPDGRETGLQRILLVLCFLLAEE